MGSATPPAAPPAIDGGNFAQLRRLKERYPRLKLLIPAGGWSGSGRFSDVGLTPESRQLFAKSAVDVFIRRSPGLFDGIDLDWEYPVRGGLATNAKRPEDRQTFTLLLQALRQELDAQGARDGRRYLLSIATIAGPGVFNQLRARTRCRDGRLVQRDVVRLPLKLLQDRALQRATLHGHRRPDARLHRRLHRATLSRRRRQSDEARRRRPVSIAAVRRRGGGERRLFQAVAGTVPPEWKTGTDYKAIVRRNLDSLGFRSCDASRGARAVPHNATTGTWITYDDAESVGEKVAYVRAHGLGGVMAWEIGGDDGTLLRTMYQGLRAKP